MNNLKAIRQKKMITQRELATTSGVGIATICRIESEKVIPSLRTIRALAKALEMKPEEIRELLVFKQGRLL